MRWYGEVMTPLGKWQGALFHGAKPAIGTIPHLHLRGAEGARGRLRFEPRLVPPIMDGLGLDGVARFLSPDGELRDLPVSEWARVAAFLAGDTGGALAVGMPA